MNRGGLGVLAIVLAFCVLASYAEASRPPGKPVEPAAPPAEKMPVLQGDLRPVSTAPGGGLLSEDAYGAVVSGDGRWVFFATRAPEAGEHASVLAHELATGATERITPQRAGVWWQVHAASHDGQRVVLQSQDDLGVRSFFLHDRRDGDSSPLEGLEIRAVGSFSRDGTLPVLAMNEERRLEAHVLEDAAWTLLHRDPDANVMLPSLSGDGRLAAFVVHHEEGPAAYVKHISEERLERLDTAQGWPDEVWHAPSRAMVSEDGRFIAFEAWEDDVVRVFLHDRERQETREVPVPGEHRTAEQALFGVASDGSVLHRAFTDRADGMRWALFHWDGETTRLVDALDPELAPRCLYDLHSCGAWVEDAAMDAAGRTIVFTTDNILLHPDADTPLNRVFVVSADASAGDREREAPMPYPWLALVGVLVLVWRWRVRPAGR